MPTLINHSYQQKQRTCAQTVIHHLQDAPLDPGRLPREDAQHHKAQVADAGIRHQFFHVWLHHGDQRPVNDANDRQHGDGRRIRRRGCRKQRQAKTQQSIPTHFEQHPGQNHAARRRRLHVRIGKPGMEGEERHLNSKAQKKREKQPLLLP